MRVFTNLRLGLTVASRMLHNLASDNSVCPNHAVECNMR
jgi:hypothetical protein